LLSNNLEDIATIGPTFFLARLDRLSPLQKYRQIVGKWPAIDLRVPFHILVVWLYWILFLFFICTN
jgi:hypothetical protein